MKTLNIVRMVALSLLSLAAVPRSWGEDKPITLKVNWDKVLTTSKIRRCAAAIQSTTAPSSLSTT